MIIFLNKNIGERMTQKNASERIKNLITEFVFKDSYWGYLFSRINRTEDRTIPSPMGVCPEIDGSITLLYNPLFIDLMNDPFLKVVIEHEGIHLLNNHISRLLRIISNEVNNLEKNKKIKKWNLGADCAVNTLFEIERTYMIGNDEFQIVHPERFNLPERKTAEFYYENIPDENEQQMKQLGKEAGENGKKNEGGSSNNIDDHGSWTKNISKVSDIGSLASRLEQYVEQALEESYNNVRRKGNLPGYVTERINEILSPPSVPYYDIIKKLVKGSRLTKYKRAYTRINKKRVYSFFIDQKNLPIISPFPGKTKDFSFNITIILDTSGSMSLDDIMEGLSAVKNIIENDKYCKTTIIENDTQIQKEYEIKKLNSIQYNIRGRGGTILLPALIRCRELKSDVTLVFTDGYCDDINNVNRRLLPKRIIWILTNNGSNNMIDKTGYIVRLPK